MEYRTKRRLRRCLSVSIRLYALAILLAAGYGLLWLFDLAGLVDTRPATTAWVAVVAMCGLLLVLLVPIYQETRTLSR